jgi:hypothetical protein
VLKFLEDLVDRELGAAGEHEPVLAGMASLRPLAPRLVAGRLRDRLGCQRPPVRRDGGHLRGGWLDHEGKDVVAAMVREHRGQQAVQPGNQLCGLPGVRPHQAVCHPGEEVKQDRVGFVGELEPSGTVLWVQARPVPVARGAGQAVGSAGSGGAVRQMT